MSHDGNTQLLETYQETFEEAVAVENWAMARAVIGDLLEEGFHASAVTMERLLAEAQSEDHDR